MFGCLERGILGQLLVLPYSLVQSDHRNCSSGNWLVDFLVKHRLLAMVDRRFVTEFDCKNFIVNND